MLKGSQVNGTYPVQTDTNAYRQLSFLSLAGATNRSFYTISVEPSRIFCAACGSAAITPYTLIGSRTESQWCQVPPPSLLKLALVSSLELPMTSITEASLCLHRLLCKTHDGFGFYSTRRPMQRECPKSLNLEYLGAVKNRTKYSGRGGKCGVCISYTATLADTHAIQGKFATAQHNSVSVQSCSITLKNSEC